MLGAHPDAEEDQSDTVLPAAGQHFSQSAALPRNPQSNVSVLEAFGKKREGKKKKEVYETQVASSWLSSPHKPLIYRLSHCRYNGGMKCWVH